MKQTTNNCTDNENNRNNSLFIFRRDLRIHDNTGLSAFYASLSQYLEQNQKYQSPFSGGALYILTPNQWLQHDMALVQVELILRTLPTLATSLYQQLGIHLHVSIADDFIDSVAVIHKFCQDNDINQVFANHEYELNEINRDNQLLDKLNTDNIQCNIYHDQCILPPETVQNGDGKMYRVFTPFYKKWLKQLEMNPPHLHTCLPQSSDKKSDTEEHQQNISDIKNLCNQVLQDYTRAWQSNMEIHFGDEDINKLLKSSTKEFPAGEVNACYRLDQFISEDIHQYDIARDVPSLNATSGLSPYLAIGAMSPRLCYLQATKALSNAQKTNSQNTTDIYRWISELAWRDFYRHVLVTKPDLIKHQAYLVEMDNKVDWSYDTAEFSKWCEGKTGVPLVDSAMRCLNATGFMHNRLRMVVAMFLTKDLLIDWRWGERYFMQTLIDGDFASNNGGWQWSASTGTDASPYFRIMNPFSQGKTHDPDAIFIKEWLPELQEVSPKILHDENKLNQFLNGNLLVDYPKPMVDHKQARLRTIEIFKG